MPLRPGFGGKGVGLWEVISSRLNGDKKKIEGKMRKTLPIYKKGYFCLIIFLLQLELYPKSILFISRGISGACPCSHHGGGQLE